MESPTKWEDYLHLVEFSFNNGYEASSTMIPFEILYGKKCDTPISWDSHMDRLIVGPEMLQEMEQTVRKVQKSYADLKRQHKEFSVGDHVYL